MSTARIFSLVVVVDIDYLLQNFHETEENIKTLVFQVTYMIAGIVTAVIIVAILYDFYLNSKKYFHIF